MAYSQPQGAYRQAGVYSVGRRERGKKIDGGWRKKRRKKGGGREGEEGEEEGRVGGRGLMSLFRDTEAILEQLTHSEILDPAHLKHLDLSLSRRRP